jgi:nucleotide-binding universal stress UspA family protein
MLEDTRERYAQAAEQHAEQYLAVITLAATEAGVACDALCVTSNHPYEAILQTAEERKCDLIVMASHGRGGIKGLLIGSETQKVLTHSQISVLVHR